jgi:prepilin signal peptidase PulO-like enzyme (type II secretory pathway)
MDFDILYPLFGFILFTGLCALSWIDIKTYRLPNSLTYPLIVFGVGSSFLLPSHDTKDSLIGLIIGYIGLVTIETIFRALYKKEGLGRGDAKLLSVGGAWCGWFGLPYIILIASFSGLVFAFMYSRKKTPTPPIPFIPFGPFLSFGILTIWAAQTYLWHA